MLKIVQKSPILEATFKEQIIFLKHLEIIDVMLDLKSQNKTGLSVKSSKICQKNVYVVGIIRRKINFF